MTTQIDIESLYDQINIVTTRIKSVETDEINVYDRQLLLPSFNQEALESTSFILLGAGGVGSEIGEGLARKGAGRVTIVDHDIVELSNLNRQHFFEADLFKSKSTRLAVNLARRLTCGTIFNGIALSFEDALVMGCDLHADIAICGVDDNQSRVRIAKYYHDLGTPVINVAMDYKAENGHVFVQEPGGACFGCAFPKLEMTQRPPVRQQP
jgi:molybdopterin-synthase adenylyltransferase